MDPGVDPWCLTGPPLPRLLRTYEDARVWGLTLQVWREVCWPRTGALLGLLSLPLPTARHQHLRQHQHQHQQDERRPVRLWRAAHGRAYVKALEYIVTHDLDSHRPGQDGAVDYVEGGEGEAATATATAIAASTTTEAKSQQPQQQPESESAAEPGSQGGSHQAIPQQEEKEEGVVGEEDDDDDEEHLPSLGALLGETLRVALASILLDLSQVPFLNVSVCALAGRGRLPALQPQPQPQGPGAALPLLVFQGYGPAFWAMWALEGPLGLFTGTVPVCLLGLLHNWDLLAALLIGEGGDDGSGGDGSGSSDTGGANPWVSSGALAKRISSGYFSSVFSPSSSLASLGGGQRTPHAHARPHPEEPASAAPPLHHSHHTEHLLRLVSPSPGAAPQQQPAPPPPQQQQQQQQARGSTSPLSDDAASVDLSSSSRVGGRKHALATAAKGTTGKALPRLVRALLTHPLQLWALACMTDPDPRFRSPNPLASLAHLRAVVGGGWRGLWRGAGTTLLTAFLPLPLPHLAVPLLLRSRHMLAVLDGGRDRLSDGSTASSSSSSSSSGQGILSTLRTLISKDGLREVACGWQALAWGALPSVACLLAARAAIDFCLGEGPRKRRRWALRRARVRRVMARQLAREMRREERQEAAEAQRRRTQQQRQQRRQQQQQQDKHVDKEGGAGFRRRRPLPPAPGHPQQQEGQGQPQPQPQPQQQPQQQRAQVHYRYFDEEPTVLPLPPSEAALILPSSPLSSSTVRPPQPQPEEQVTLRGQQGQGLAGAVRVEEEERGAEASSSSSSSSQRPLQRRQRRFFFTEHLGGQEREEGQEKEEGQQQDGNPQSPARRGQAQQQQRQELA